MKKEIKNIWIESEDKGPIIGGTSEVNDNSDVIITFSDESRYVASFFTFENIEHLRQKNKRTGEFLNGKFFWASDLILVERIKREEIEQIIEHLIAENEFESIFTKVDQLK